MKHIKVAIIIEKADNNYCASAPAFDGCVSTGDTVEETIRNMHRALTLHIEGMVEDGDFDPSKYDEAGFCITSTLDIPLNGVKDN